MNSTRLIAAWLLCSAQLVTSSARAASESTEVPNRPNVVLILSDDQRWDTIRALGNDEINTPNLDRLVNQGFHFNNAYCMGSMVGAVCTPSRAMIMTGRSLWRLPNVEGERAPSNVSLLPRLLNDAGYTTFRTEKHNNNCKFASVEFQINYSDRIRSPEAAKNHADRVIEFLERYDSASPFFVYMAPPVPHDPRIAPPEYMHMYLPERLTLSPNFLPEHPFDNGALKIRDETLAPWPRDPEAMRQHLADYYASITYLDTQVGRLIEVLNRRRQADRTIIIFTSDHGLAVGGRHGLMGKQNLYEHVKPPLVFSGPGIPHGQSDSLVYLYDLFPTIADLAGAPVPDDVEGASLLPIILGKVTRTRDYLLGAYIDCQRMVRDQQWKLIEYSAGGKRNTQLFDLATDPDELHNRAADEKCAQQLRRMRAKLLELRREFGDPIRFEDE